MKNFAKFFGIIAFVAIIGFSMTACDDDSFSGGGSIDSKLVLDDGWAWVLGDSDGYIFKADGTYLKIWNDNGTWVYSDSGEWFTKNGWLSIDYNETTYTVSADGNTLELYNTYTKTQVTIQN